LICWSCGEPGPAGQFCGACGAPTAVDGSRPHPAALPVRRHAFASDPTQPTLSPRLLATLLPHLPRERRRRFGFALGAAVVVLAIVGGLGWVGPAHAATALVPLIFILYLWEVEVYAGDATLGVGVLVLSGAAGVVWWHLTATHISEAYVRDVLQGLSFGRVLRSGVGLAVASQLAMATVAILVVLVEPMTEGLDSFVTGALGGMGFAVGITVANLWPDLRAMTVHVGSPVSGALRLVSQGMLVHLVDGLGSGVLVATVWLARTRRAQRGGGPWPIIGALSLVVVLQGVIGAVNVSVKSATVAFVVCLAAIGVLLLCARLVLHQLLLAEAVPGHFGPSRACTQCGAVTPATSFCVNCGIALKATPKRQTTGVRRT
jgi:hypothetical protein